MTSGRRALDKIYKRRDRYDIPDWQREEVWDKSKKQQLIDSILRGWKLPKFYFSKTSGVDDEYEVVDGQQRLMAIYEFYDNELPLSLESANEFGGTYYKDLSLSLSDSFDDFEIEYDEIEGATDEELKAFFQRLQAGLPLRSSEKLNAVDSKLRDFCKKMASHSFFNKKVSIPDTRYAHFDIITKAAAVEIEGIETSLRFEDLKRILENHRSFSIESPAAKRVSLALDYLDRAFPDQNPALRSRTIVQSLITITCKIMTTGKEKGHETNLRNFFEQFVRDLSRQVELGQSATDGDFIVFQRSVNANLRTGTKTRHSILLKKLFSTAPVLAEIFDPSVIAESGLSQQVKSLGSSVLGLVCSANTAYAAKYGIDLFKPTSKTMKALGAIGTPITNDADYACLIDDLYFLLYEGCGQRLSNNMPQSFQDINLLRTDLRHDVDHGSKSKAKTKRKTVGQAFAKYAGSGNHKTLDPARFVAVQAALLSAVELDLRTLIRSL